jgi:hypothetical protein
MLNCTEKRRLLSAISAARSTTQDTNYTIIYLGFISVSNFFVILLVVEKLWKINIFIKSIFQFLDKTIKCSQCDSMVSYGHMARHKMTVHGGNYKPNPRDKKCTICRDQRNFTLTGFKAHVSYHHPGEFFIHCFGTVKHVKHICPRMVCLLSIQEIVSVGFELILWSVW